MAYVYVELKDLSLGDKMIGKNTGNLYEKVGNMLVYNHTKHEKKAYSLNTIFIKADKNNDPMEE